MGSVADVCRGICDEQGHEILMLSGRSPNISFIKEIKKQESNPKKSKKFVPYNVSNEIIINTNIIF